MSIVEYETAVRLYFEQLPPGSSQVIPDRAEYDISRDVVILRRGGKVLATYNVRDLEAVAEWTGGGDGNQSAGINYELF